MRDEGVAQPSRLLALSGAVPLHVSRHRPRSGSRCAATRARRGALGVLLGGDDSRDCELLVDNAYNAMNAKIAHTISILMFRNL